MKKEKLESRVLFLKDLHKTQHKIIEALEAERAPEEIIARHKKLKLSIKDEIYSLEQQMVDTSHFM